ncbi:MAG TPA: hypothetical protein VLN44_09330 [Pyrinomonadaceae bacterium]|nr:hypothetical protein [Pyrinomonadaceae bacterium]
MSGFYFPFALTVAGMVLYHLSQKSVPPGVNPFLVIVLAYVVGIALCVVCAVAYPGKKNLIESVKLSNWAVFTLGAAAALIELGFLLAYRAGWKISMAAVATNAAAAIALIPIGILIYKDHLSWRNAIGLAFCIFGLAMVMRD